MSPLSFFKRHPRDDLSAYLDGELALRSSAAVEVHLRSCAACARHLEELRAARAALRTLPEVGAPRSFALTPDMVRGPARRAAAPARVPSLVASLRVASVGLTFALAVVLVIDVAGGGGGGGGSSTTGYESAAFDYGKAVAPGALESATTGTVAVTSDEGDTLTLPTDTGPQPNPASPAASPAPGVGGVGNVGSAASGSSAGIGGPDNIPSSPVSVPPETVAPPTSTVVDQAPSADTLRSTSTPTPLIEKDAYGSVITSAPVPASVPQANGSASSGGLGGLTIVAIVLGVLLAASVLGSIAAARMTARKR